ncbi:hypothetical protein OEZ85_011779 [Tetradesmus obliquus]|uniref:Uncharacterized protein n=1 Tax=Tetradesmus obliquus TaxID=3088 RepID=A0ABY8TRP9_TETOB|nr:hypothetical protein OEZ85_011779 [Tetradesmus obliquus]
MRSSRGDATLAAAAQRGGYGVPSDAAEVEQRVAALQRLLGEAGAARALQRWPGILGSSPELLALHLAQWLFFFGDDDNTTTTTTTTSSSSRSSSNESGLRARLAASPQLLAVDAEHLVGNLYELGAMVQAEDLDTFARRAMQLALARPSTLQQKMRRLLLLLNSEGQRAAEAAGAAAAAAAGEDAATASARRRTASLVAPEFSLAQLQAAARRDHRWLAMSSEALQARLLGLQQALGVSMSVAGRLFLKQPSILHKSSSLLQQRIASLQALPGLGQQRAVHVVVAFPALLNLQPEVLQERWQLLQQAAATSPAWQQQLSAMPAATLASILPLSSSRYSRLQQVAACRQQPRRTMRGVLCMSEAAFEAFAGRHLHAPQQSNRATAAAAAAAAAAAGGGRGEMLLDGEG